MSHSYYQQPQYRRKRFASAVSNLLWRAVMLAISLIVIAACIYGCREYIQIMGTEI